MNQGPTAIIKMAPRNKDHLEFAVFPHPALVAVVFSIVDVAMRIPLRAASSVAVVVATPVPCARPVRIRAIVLGTRLVTTVRRALTSLAVAMISAIIAHLALTSLLKVIVDVIIVHPAQPLRKVRLLVTQFPAVRAHTSVQVVATTAMLVVTPILAPPAAPRARLVNINRTEATLIATIAGQAKLLPLAQQVVIHATVMPACMLARVVVITALLERTPITEPRNALRVLLELTAASDSHRATHV